MMSATTKIFSNSEIFFVRFIQIVSLWEKSELNPARLEQKNWYKGYKFDFNNKLRCYEPQIVYKLPKGSLKRPPLRIERIW